MLNGLYFIAAVQTLYGSYREISYPSQPFLGGKGADLDNRSESLWRERLSGCGTEMEAKGVGVSFARDVSRRAAQANSVKNVEAVYGDLGLGIAPLSSRPMR